MVGDPIFFFCIFFIYLSFAINLPKISKSYPWQIFENISILHSIEIHIKKGAPLKALFFVSCYFFVSWDFLEWLHVNHTYVRGFVARRANLAHIYRARVLSTIFAPLSHHWFCNTAICRPKLKPRSSLIWRHWAKFKNGALTPPPHQFGAPEFFSPGAPPG